MTITVLSIGKNKDKSLQALQAEYLKRLSAFCKAEVIEVKDEANDRVEREAECDKIKEKEASHALEKLRPDDYVVLLDLHGQMYSSEVFASKLAKWEMNGKRLVFVIAGSLGPAKALTDRADERWKLSDLTFTHLMTRVLVLEQVYRGFMINAGRNYHK